MNLLDEQNFDLIPDGIMLLLKEGFEMINEQNSRYWTGTSNVYNEVKIFQKIDEQGIKHLINLSDKVTPNNVILLRSIDVRLTFPIDCISFTIEKKSSFSLFKRKSSELIRDFYLFKNLDADNLTLQLNNCLFHLKEKYLKISVNKNICEISLIHEEVQIEMYDILALIKAVIYEIIR